MTGYNCMLYNCARANSSMNLQIGVERRPREDDTTYPHLEIQAQWA